MSSLVLSEALWGSLGLSGLSGALWGSLLSGVLWCSLKLSEAHWGSLGLSGALWGSLVLSWMELSGISGISGSIDFHSFSLGFH